VTATQTPSVDLEVTGLTLGYGDRHVIEDLDLSIPPGRVTAIVGPTPAASRPCCDR